jgi:hypothetical protein
MWQFHVWVRFKRAQQISTWRPHASATYTLQIRHAMYGAKTEYWQKMKSHHSRPHNVTQCHTHKKVTWSILYYARAVDLIVLMPLNDMETEQTKTTEKTQAATNHLLDYLATRPDATIIHHAHEMILHSHSDASYISVSNARSRLGGLFFCGKNPGKKISWKAPSLMLLLSSKTWSPPQTNRKLERVFITPKVDPHSDSHSLRWATYSPRRPSAQITPPYLES